MPAARWGRETERGVGCAMQGMVEAAICMEVARPGMHGAATNPVGGGIRDIPDMWFFLAFFSPSVRDLLSSGCRWLWCRCGREGGTWWTLERIGKR